MRLSRRLPQHPRHHISSVMPTPGFGKSNYAHLAPSYVADTIRASISRGLGLQRKADPAQKPSSDPGWVEQEIRLKRW
jgi:hypothetical protein